MPSSKSWTKIRVPESVGEWLVAMSRHIGTPVHRVLRVLLDRYVERLPKRSQRRIAKIMAQRRQRPQ